MLTEYEIALQSQANFTINVLNQIVNSNEEVVFSPFSLTLTLAMLFIGAGGKTEIEFKNLLSPNVDKTKYFEFLEDSINNINIQSTKQIQISDFLNYFDLKNPIFPRNSRSKLQEYLETQFKNVDYNNSTTVAEAINDYIKNINYDKFDNMIIPLEIDHFTEYFDIHLMSNIFKENNFGINEKFIENLKKYFKPRLEFPYFTIMDCFTSFNGLEVPIIHNGNDNMIALNKSELPMHIFQDLSLNINSQWLEKFDNKLSKDDNFYTTRTEKKIVRMMNMKKKLLYGSDENFHVVKLQYSNKNSSFVLILPKMKNMLHSLLHKFNSSNFLNLIRSTAPEDIILSMPRFNIESFYLFDELLIKMGLKTPFDESADFSSITSKKGFRIYGIYQKVFVHVNENGTTTFEATDVIFKAFSLKIRVKKEIIVRADHPFLFFILNNDDILISGIYQ